MKASILNTESMSMWPPNLGRLIPDCGSWILLACEVQHDTEVGGHLFMPVPTNLPKLGGSLIANRATSHTGLRGIPHYGNWGPVMWTIVPATFQSKKYLEVKSEVKRSTSSKHKEPKP
jgi:hypothetical protein